MCGIVGLFLKDHSLQTQLGQLLSQMLITMSDRGPDSAGVAIYGEPANTESKITIQSDKQNNDFETLESILREKLDERLDVSFKDTHAVIRANNTKIKFLVTGNDVMHSFFVPSLAVQTYAFVGRSNEVWIDVPPGEKTYYGQCNQICGVNHSFMPIVVKALARDKYEKWLLEAKKDFALSDGPDYIQLASVKK